MKQVKRAVVVVLLLLVVGLIIVLAKPERHTSFDLPDGSTIALVGITYGTNVLIHGSVLERFLGDRIPPQGISILGRKMNRPAELRPVPSSDASITAWFEQSNRPGNYLDFPDELAKWKIFARSKEGRRYENAPGMPTFVSPTVAAWSMPITAFPRAEKEFKLELHLWNAKRRDRPVVEFRIPNPAPRSPTPFPRKPLPQTNQLEGVQLILSRVRAGHSPSLGGASVQFYLRYPPGHGFPSLEWEITECSIEDEEGNRRDLSHMTRGSDPSLDSAYSLAADQPWKVSVTLARMRNPVLELTVPASGSSNQVSITAGDGQTFLCRFDGQSVEIESPGWVTARLAPKVTLMARSAGDEPGWLTYPQWSVTNGHYRALKWTLAAPASAPELRLELDSPRVLHTEFVAIPESN